MAVTVTEVLLLTQDTEVAVVIKVILTDLRDLHHLEDHLLTDTHLTTEEARHPGHEDIMEVDTESW